MPSRSVRHVWLLAGHLAVLAIVPGCDATQDEAPPVRIDVLFAYTPGVTDLTDDVVSDVEAAVNATNAVYREGRIDVELGAVAVVPVDYQLTDKYGDLQRLVRPADGHLDTLHALRTIHAADIVVLVAEARSATVNAAVMATPETAFAIVHAGSMGAPDFALAHELGHLQGARHHPGNDTSDEPFPFGHGFNDGRIRTIMAGGPGTLVPRFSGPDQEFEGMVLGDAELHNVARVLRSSARYIANFRGETIPTAFVPPGTWPTRTY